MEPRVVVDVVSYAVERGRKEISYDEFGRGWYAKRAGGAPSVL